MTLTVDFWQLVIMCGAVVTAFWALVRMALSQIDRRLSERFKAMETTRETDGRHWDEKFTALLEQNKREADSWQSVERDFLHFKAELPLNYVRRDDHVRNQTVIEAKLDALALKIENIQLKGKGIS